MMLTLSTTCRPATDLGYLLHKNPAMVQRFSLPLGRAVVFYPEASEDRCTAALLLTVTPADVVEAYRRRMGRSQSVPATPERYVNDRPYVASSLLSMAIARVFGSALNGHSRERPALMATPLPLEARLDVVACRGGAAMIHRLFAPLGYKVETTALPFPTTEPGWEASPYFSVSLSGELRVGELLSHLYVLLPVMDNGKHYFIGDAEVRKLLTRGSGWLPRHPECALIVRRYLGQHRGLIDEAFAQLAQGDAADAGPGDGATDTADVEVDAAENDAEPGAETGDDHDENACGFAHDDASLSGGFDPAARVPLHDQRLDAVASIMLKSGARSVLDLGCGDGRLLSRLLRQRQFQRIVGMEVSLRELNRATRRLQLDALPERQRQRIELVQGSLLYRDARLQGFDAAALVEVIEHLDPARLDSCGAILFGVTRPMLVVVTTPNAEYNVRYASLNAEHFRHRDHRFEWTRGEFRTWAEGMAERHGYAVRFEDVGPFDESVGAPTQLGIFTR